MNKKECKSDNSNRQAKQYGYFFNIDEAKWKLDSGSSVNVGVILKFIHSSLIEGYINTLAFYASNYSAGYVRRINVIMKDFFIRTNSIFVSEFDILNYRSLISYSKIKDLIVLRAFLKKWHSIGYYGVDDSVITLMKSMVLKVKTRGSVIKQEDPNKGAMTDNEHNSLNQAIHSAYKDKKITLLEYSSALLVSFTGRRASQLIALKFKDIIKNEKSDGSEVFFLRIPRVKQGFGFRQIFRELRIDGNLYNVMMRQANNSISLVEAYIDRHLLLEEKNEVPVFLDTRKYEILSGKVDVFDLLVSDRLHAPKNIFGVSLKKIVKKENVISERTGERITVNAYRLRYTLGTKLAREGYRDEIIAELLDHSSILSVGIYTENLADNAEKINQAVSNGLALIADAFLGKAKISGVAPKHNSGDLLTGKTSLSCIKKTAMPCHGCIYFKKSVKEV